MNNETSETKNMILEEKLVTKSNNTTNTRMNSITVLLEEFREQDISFEGDEYEPTQPIMPNPFAMSSSISLPSSSQNSTISDKSLTSQLLLQECTDHWLSELPLLYEAK